ncbi:MAG: TonB-dependent receptor, partial [Acidobacteria bacterium]|nr:TonB-dependent receptor [Acidobacteriota bacterium]
MQSQLNRLGLCLCIALIACLFHAGAASAQTAATIVGDITDSSGAAIPSVLVTVIHEGTGIERKVQTNEAGQYRITPLNPGTYAIQVESAGFKRQVRSGVVLEVSAVLEVDFTLQVGAPSETIEVTAVTPVLRTEEASVGNVVNSQDLQSLPVNQRNYTRLILLMSGTSSVTRSQQRGTGASGTGLFSVNGGRPQDNNFTLDGLDSNMMMMNSPGISPPMDAIQEFKVATNTGSEFGRSMGANVSMVMKSGTRDLHGTFYEYLRNDKFDANEFFANRSALGKTPFRLNQYGVAVGGPILLPRADFRDKMFWFFAWEGFRRRRGSAVVGSVPPADFRRGDFSSLLTQSSPIYLKDPLLTGNCSATDRTACFPNNIIPQGRINKAIPTALELIVPLPNRSGQVQNLVGNRSQANDRDSFHGRWDYNLNPRNSFFFRYSSQNAGLIDPNVIPNISNASRFDVVNYGGSWVHIFSPTTTLEIGFGTNQPADPNIGTKPVTRAEYFARTGIQMYQREVFSDPLVNISFGAYSIPSASGGSSGDNVWQGRGNLSIIRGRHSLKIGGQYHYRNFFTNTANPMNGDAIFNGQLTGFPMADALLGYPSEVRRGQGNTLTDSIGHYVLGHIQDDWRVSSNLTVNLGLMYQLGTRPYDKTDRLGNLWVHLDPASGKVVGDLMWATTNPELDPVTGKRNEPARTFGFG